ncbi:hexose carrier protein HEX6 isoform X1 [Eucalyptus grandis]|uniref:hexose carrier protein HEX6 isoform X1 n=1 Tax=Eucalyptus grandis TaxID=71139 RepID=UPI00192EEF5C|nr:hexose carrier protein HEX6 isoform X1 [Eucalyptus grandis]
MLCSLPSCPAREAHPRNKILLFLLQFKFKVNPHVLALYKIAVQDAVFGFSTLEYRSAIFLLDAAVFTCQDSRSGSNFCEVCHWRKAMAVGVAVSNEPAVLYNGRITVFVAVSCMVAATGGIIFGYDIGISGGVTSMEPFLKKFFRDVYDKVNKDTKISNYCKYDNQLLTLFTSSLYISGLVASFFASSVTRAFGRKPSILVGGASFLAGSALGGAASNVYMLIFGRILLGVGVGFANQSVPLYISEMAPPRHRGLFNNGFQFCVGIGVLSANLINYGTEKIEGGWGWRISLAMAAVPASILTVGALFLPETANSLIQRSDDHEKAEAMLRRIRGVNDVQAELNDLVKASSISKTVDHPFRNIIQREYRPQLVMSIAIPFFQQVTGINVISFYAPVLFRTIGLGESASLLSAVVTGLVGTISTFISMLVVDKLGRRKLFMIGGFQMLASQAMVGGIMASKLGDHGGISQAYGYLVLVLICIYVAGFAWSWGPLGWLVPSEIYPLEIRSAGQSITVAVGFLFTFLVAQTFLLMLCHFKSGIFFFFGGWVVIMTAFVYLLLPETKNVPLEQMNKIWREHWFWKNVMGEMDVHIDKTEA